MFLFSSVTTLRQIQERIAAEEFMATDDGVEIEQEHSPGSFINMGLEIEEQQYVFGRTFKYGTLTTD
jgi:hypothetical protein